MANDLIEIGDVEEEWNVAGTRLLRYSANLFHKGLKEHKQIKANDTDLLMSKVETQIDKWNDKWRLIQDKVKAREEKEANVQEAERRSSEARDAISAIESILNHTLSVDDKVDWETLKQKTRFAKSKPSKPSKRAHEELPLMPDKNSVEFKASYSLLDSLLKSRKRRKEADCESKYREAIAKWEHAKKVAENRNRLIDADSEKTAKKWDDATKLWETEKDNFYRTQKVFNAKIDHMKQLYLKQDQEAITEYCELVLEKSEYPESFPKNFEIEYNPESRILIIEYQLPCREHMPNVKEVKYVATKKALKETFLSESQINKLFDSAIYQITLRSIHELTEADVAEAISAVSFNGWVNSIDKATGMEANSCIVSIQVKKSEFLLINLANVDPKACFKKLKGVASSKLSSLIPIKPILNISKKDKRFVESYAVADSLDDSVNVAAMDWEDFEHLVREVFEKEFSTNGGEVKVTQASRDGGVDAIAFDPDPIRGGKIVIQAKRYTNTVGVSAVRDLYGTVVNEGATKGVLVSTADYGPDAYEFAQDKPLTLLNGSNLLHLLEKHGHHAKIDLKEAKRALSEDK